MPLPLLGAPLLARKNGFSFGSRTSDDDVAGNISRREGESVVQPPLSVSVMATPYSAMSDPSLTPPAAVLASCARLCCARSRPLIASIPAFT